MTDPAWSVSLGVLGVLLAVRYLGIWIEMANLPRWIGRERDRVIGRFQHALDQGQRLPQLWIVVPAYEEASSIGHTLNALLANITPQLQPLVRILVVTTEKEDAHRRALNLQTNDASTRDAIQPYLDRRQIDWLHSGDPFGNLATQLNLSRTHIAKTCDDPGSTYLVVFNADTLPAPDSIERLMDLLLAERFPEAVQLMCIPVRNLRATVARGGLYAAAAALYQSRWALGYEFGMMRRRQFPSLQSTYHYCRGHGMTFRMDFLLDIGPFETRTELEDLFQGYVLSRMGKCSPPVPVLEWTDHPESTRELVRQKAFWYRGMLDVFKYPRWFAERKLPSKGQLHATWLLVIGAYREVFTWLVGPLLTAIFMIGCVIAGGWSLGWVLLPIANAVGTVVLVLRTIPGDLRPSPTSVRVFVGLGIGVLCYSMTRNFGPLLACVGGGKKVF